MDGQDLLVRAVEVLHRHIVKRRLVESGHPSKVSEPHISTSLNHGHNKHNLFKATTLNAIGGMTQSLVVSYL